MRHLLPCSVLFAACSGKDADPVTLDDDTAPGPADTAPTPTSPPEPLCDQPLNSICGNPYSVLRGSVRLAPGVGPARGDLFLAVTHDVYDGSIGGGYHTHLVLPDVDLSSPVPFALDMCTGGEMWSEENCTYGLVAILDLDGDQGTTDLTPDAGEPATRVPGIRMSCEAEPACQDVVLDCTDGAPCVQFTELSSCTCESPGCTSDFALCY